MFHCVPRRRLYTLFEQSRYMPSDHDGCRDKPAKYGVSNYASEPMHGAGSCKGPKGHANEILWEAMQQTDRWRSQQNQRRRDCHQEEMLRHMRREQMV